MAEHVEYPAYPVGLRLTGRRVVVIGGGQVAQRRLPALIAAGADIVLVSPEATPSVEAMADAGEIRWERRAYADGDLADAWYALIATSDPRRTPPRPPRPSAAASGASAATTPTRPPPGRPATGRSEGITVAVLTPGRDPRRSAAIRDAIVEGLRDGTLVAPAPPHPRTAGVALVGGGPGDPDLITVRGRRLLAEADVVIADRLGPRDLLAELAAARRGDRRGEDPVRPVHGPGGHQQRPDRARQGGQVVVRLKGGDPFVFGRGMEEAQALAEAGRPVHGRARHLQLDLRARRGRDPGHPPGCGPRVHRGQRPCRPRRRALPGRLAGRSPGCAAPWCS